MCSKRYSVAMILGCLLLGAFGYAQDADSTALDSVKQKASVDTTAVNTKFNMLDLGVAVEPTEEEKEAATQQLEAMANQSAKDLAQQEQTRARTRIDSLMRADSAQQVSKADSVATASSESTQQDTSVQLADAEESASSLESPAESDTLITLTELQQHLNSLRTKYQEEIADLRERNLQLVRKIEYLEGEIREIQSEPSVKARRPETPPSLHAAQSEERPAPEPRQIHLEKTYLLGIRSYYASNFADALGKFQRVVDTANDRVLATNAQYWIGECYYQLGNFSQAIQEMDQYITEFQATKQRKDALVIMGLASKRLGQLKQALTYFETVVQDYPDSEYAKIARSEVKKLRYLTS